MATSSSLITMNSTELIKTRRLDYGGFGEVFLCYHKTLGHVVQKRVYTGPPRQDQKSLLEEGMLMSQLNHERVVKLLGVILEDKNYSLVMEYIPKGNLLVMLKEVDVPMSVKARIIVEILQGMVYLSSNKVIHKDLKPENILVDKEFHIKIADLGLATCKTWSRLTRESRRKSRGGQSCAGTTGTLYYIAPEHLKNINTCFTEKSDVYSFAIVIWVILTNQEPYENVVSPDQLHYCVSNGNRPDEKLIPSGAPEEIVQLMRRCWNQDPEERPTFKESYKKFLPFYMQNLEKDIDKDLENLSNSYTGPPELKDETDCLTTEKSFCLAPPVPSYLSMTSVDSPTTLKSSNMEPVEQSLEDLGLHSEDFQDDARAAGPATPVSPAQPLHLEQKLNQELNYHKNGSYTPEQPVQQPASLSNLPPASMSGQRWPGDPPQQVSSVQSWCNPTPDLSPVEDQQPHAKESIYRPEYGSYVSTSNSHYLPYTQPSQAFERMPSYSGVASPLFSGLPAEGVSSFYIRQASGIQIGNNNTLNLSSMDSGSLGSQFSSAGSSSRYKELLQKYEDHAVTEDHLDVVRKNLGKKWKSCARRLDLSDVDIESIEHDYARDGLAEQVHQMLARWKMREGLHGCTVGKLCHGLEFQVRSEVLLALLDMSQKGGVAHNGGAGDGACQ